MPVEKKGNKGSSPKVYGYFKIDGDKATRNKKNCSRCGKGVYMSTASILFNFPLDPGKSQVNSLLDKKVLLTSESVSMVDMYQKSFGYFI